MFFTKWKKQEEINKSSKRKLVELDNSLQTSFSNVKEDVKHLQSWIQYLHGSQDQFGAQLKDMDRKFETLLTKDEIKHFTDEYYRQLTQLSGAISSVKTDISGQIQALVQEQESLKKDLTQTAQDRDKIFDHLAHLNRVIQKSEGKLIELNTAMEVVSTNQTQREGRFTDLQAEIDSIRQEVREKQPISTQNTKIEQNNPLFEKLEVLNQQMQSMQHSVTEIQSKSPRQNLKEKIFKKVTRHSKDYVKSMLISLIKKYNKISGLGLREIVVEEQGIVSKSSFYRLLTEIEDEEGVHVLHEGKEKIYFWTAQAAPHSPDLE